MYVSDYSAYLLSDWWRQKRQQVLTLAHNMCERCGAREPLEVHHWSYDLYNESVYELSAVCHPCHEIADAQRLNGIRPQWSDRAWCEIRDEDMRREIELEEAWEEYGDDDDDYQPPVAGVCDRCGESCPYENDNGDFVVDDWDEHGNLVQEFAFDTGNYCDYCHHMATKDD